jgi:hypothetical protein
VSPLLAKSQDEYNSAMAQAIARCRRYRQEKTVHIYQFAALRTIDVDILEHRSRRFDAICSPGTSWKEPSGSGAKDKESKMKLVRNRKGQYGLVPVSWLADRKFYKQNSVDTEAEDFTSLIKFPDTFESGGSIE